MRIIITGACGHIGSYVAENVHKIKKVKNTILVEPSPVNVDLLKKNLALNGYSNVETHMAAISDVDTKKEFYLSEMSNLNSFHVDSKYLKNYNNISFLMLNNNILFIYF